MAVWEGRVKEVTSGLCGGSEGPSHSWNPQMITEECFWGLLYGESVRHDWSVGVG